MRDTKWLDIKLRHLDWYIRTTKMELKQGLI